LIAKNEREAAQDRMKLEEMSSPVALVKEAMRMVNLASRCKKSEGDSAVAGWARTVASGCAESIARSAPSAVPSLDSVGDSTMESVAASLKAKRVEQYNAELVVLEETFDSMGAYSVIEYENTKKALKKKFEDVLYTEAELAREAGRAEIIREFLMSGAPVTEKYEVAEKYGYDFTS